MENEKRCNVPMNEMCKEKFRGLEKRLDDGEKLISEHTTDIAIVQTTVSALVKSMNGLTKALWGICGTTLATLFGFLLWYIQKL